MAVNRKLKYILLELEWMEKKLKDFQAALDGYNLANLEDRLSLKPTKNGGTVMVVLASKEDQLKAIMFILEKLPKVMESVAELREEADIAKNVKGGEDKPEGFDDK